MHFSFVCLCDRQIERTRQLTQQAEVEKLMAVLGGRSGLASAEKVIRTKAGKQFTSYIAQKNPNAEAADDSNNQQAQVGVASLQFKNLNVHIFQKRR
jgi:hypothetical protein